VGQYLAANRAGLEPGVLVLRGGQAESLFDLGLPVEVAELPVDLAALDVLSDDRPLLAPIEAAWAAEHRDDGRPSIPMDRLVRLMIVKARSGGWGYGTLVREVSDSLHLRRFCRNRAGRPVDRG
jgi:transposase, IS5 family